MTTFGDFEASQTMREDQVVTPEVLKGHVQLLIELTAVMEQGLTQYILPNCPTFAMRELMEQGHKDFTNAGLQFCIGALALVEYCEANPEG